jgi:hypothetical protein
MDAAIPDVEAAYMTAKELAKSKEGKHSRNIIHRG